MPARLRIDFFTPLPPQPTDIANHSASLLPTLAAQADVTVWTDQEGWTELPDVAVRRFALDAPPFVDINRADAIFYNIGNNTNFHEAIYQMTRQVPGIVILHDTNLQNFFAGISGPLTAPRYIEAMRRWHGLDAEVEARGLISGKVPIETLAGRYPLTLEATENAIGVITHNEVESRALSSATRLPVYYLPLSFDGQAVPPRARGTPPWHLLVFGFIGSNRGLPVVLRALASSPVRHLFVLDIYGVLEDPAGVDTLIAELSLGPQVRRHGFVTREVLEAALARADLGINLRNPTMGEASGSQLRLWANALPTLVSRVGWYGGLPPGTVFHVDNAREIEDIQGYLTAFANDPAPFIAAGQRGRQHMLTIHSTGHYVESLLQIAREAPVQHRRRTAIDMARAASLRLLNLDGTNLFQLVAPSVADQIASLTAASIEEPTYPGPEHIFETDL
jgi:glycosyltransferase involved in cell wall biosynthesis